MLSAVSIYLFFVIWLALFVSGSTFLLSSKCPTPWPPCACSGSSGSILIFCNFVGLRALPQFGVFNASVYYLYINLLSNSITSIPNNAFRNLGSIKAESINIYLFNNNINTFEINAFAGFENVTNLHLMDNNLTTIPAAVGTLTPLQSLSILDNPLKSLDHSVLSSIAHTLTTFEIDVGLFADWPGTELRYFTKLQILTVNKIPYSHLDAYASHGLENTLTTLTMQYPRLVKIPQAICQLTLLTTLAFENSSNLNENISSIFEPCGHTLQTVTRVILFNNNLHIFPDLFSLFPSLKILNLGENMIDYIDSSKIPSGSYLNTIALYNNSFERIPSALYKLKFLVEIDLKNNNIKTVETFDLNSLSKLRTLNLNNNPLVYIAPGAFSDNPEMVELFLQNTQLDHIRQDVTHLPYLRYLYLSGRPIECTCDMSYLKHWNVSAVKEFSTPCASSTETIKTFIMTSLQSCP